MKDNFYIKILEYGEDHLEGFNYEEIKEGLKEKLGRKLKKEEGIILERYIFRAYYNEKHLPIRETIFILIEDLSAPVMSKYMINFEAYLKYFDYLELKEARKYSRKSLEYAEKSLRKAKTAIWISIITLIISVIISIYFSIIQIKTPIKINEEQFKQMIEVME